MEIDLSEFSDIDLFLPRGGLGPFQRDLHTALGVRIGALMAWPSDSEARRRFCASVAAAQMVAIEKERAPTPWLEQSEEFWTRVKADIVEEIRRQDFEPHGGLASVLNSDSIDKLSKQIDKRLDHWKSVGSQLWLCRMTDQRREHETIKGGASLNKAWSVLAKESPWNLDRLQDDWKKYSSVAHLCAALMQLTSMVERANRSGRGSEKRIMLSPSFWFFEGIAFLLGAARAYQDWATTFFPSGRSAPLLGPDRLWMIPKAFEIPPFNLAPPPLEERHLRALREYRSAQRPK
jgi:hypothetical protein